MPIVNDLNFDFSFGDYEDAKQKFIKLCISAKVSIDNIGFFGNVGFPGISDIDALVVGEAEVIRELNRRFYEERKQNERFAYLYWHRPVYVLENIIGVAKQLHTFENIHPVIEDSRLNGLFGYTDSSKVNNETLYIAWFIFLIINIAKQERRLKKGQEVSLRLMLLVYKNIFHSYGKFNAMLDQQTRVELIHPKKIRETIRDNVFNEDLRTFIENSFFYLADKTIEVFDQYCKTKMSKPNFKKKSVLVVSRELVLKRCINTFYKEECFYLKIFLNPLAFQLINEYYFGRNKTQMFKEYVVSSEKAIKEYKKQNIDYAFIKPVGKNKSYFMRSIFFAINRFV